MISVVMRQCVAVLNLTSQVIPASSHPPAGAEYSSTCSINSTLPSVYFIAYMYQKTQTIIDACG